MRWLGTTGVTLSDESGSILFDPALTRPSPAKFVTLSTVKSDFEQVKNWSKKNKLQSLKAIFISHTHFDHALDLGSFAKLFNAKVYGPSSIQGICQGYAVPNKDCIGLADKTSIPIKAKNFTVTPMEGKHGKILGMFYFAKGKIKNEIKDQPDIYDFKAQENYSYLIQHEKLTLMFWPSTRPGKEKAFLSKTKPKIDVLLLGIANRKSDQNLYDLAIQTTNPKVIIPLHWDNFFLPRDKESIAQLWGVDLEGFKNFMAKKHPNIKIITPQYDSKIDLLDFLKPNQ